MTLLQRETELLTLYRRMLKELNQSQVSQLAGPFLSGARDGYKRGDKDVQNVLLVGKATSRCWYRGDYRETDTVEIVRDRTSRFLRDRDCLTGRFWQFYNRLAEVTCPANEREQTGQHVVWTNLVKIGVHKNNPGAKVVRPQADLCRALLLEEIDFYQPSLVVFVTGSYQCELIESLLGDWRSLEVTEGVGDLWYRPRVDGLPSMLWCNHPQGKTDSTFDVWAASAKALLENA